MECPICTDKYTTKLRQKVTCPSCSHSACRPCVSKYLLTSISNPHCMNCKTEWNEDFIDAYLTKTFRNGELRKHREKVLLDREKARITEYMPYAEMYKEIETLETKKDEIEKELQDIWLRENQLKQELRVNVRRRYTLQATIDGRTGEPPRERREFIMKCPSDDCRGFLSTAWKCGVCTRTFCSDCHALKTDDHVCNEDAKASASMIRRDTHPCPKCGIRISKIDGCDQMWCTSCNTAFSWNTGQIAQNTRIHNPHYFEYLRRTNNGQIPREPEDGGPAQCGLDLNYTRVNAIYRELWHEHYENKKCLEIIESMWRIGRCVLHMQDFVIPAYQNAFQNADIQLRKEACSYLLNKVTEEEFAKRLGNNERSLSYKRQKRMLAETFVQIGEQHLRQHLQRPFTTRNIEAYITSMNEARTFINNAFIDLGKQTGKTPKKITDDWNFHDY